MEIKHFFTSVFFSILLLLFAACSEEVIEPPAQLFGTSFFPLQAGYAIEYEVEKVTFKEFEPTDTSFYYLREEIGDTLNQLNATGIAQKVLLYSRTDSLGNWQLDSVWTVRKDFNRIIKTENNISFIKLALPLESNSSWDGNALNALESKLYRIENFLLPHKELERAFKVVHQQDSSIVDKRVSWEIYGEGVGLVESLKINLQYISDITDPFYGTDSIRRGVYIHKKAINFID